MDIRQKLDEIRVSLGVNTDEELANILKTNKSNVDSWVKRKKIPEKWVLKIGQMYQPSSLHVTSIPLYPNLKASCSCGSVVCNCDNLESEQIQLPKEYLKEYLGIHSLHGVHAIVADGESMEPTIKHGDIIFVCPCEAIKDGKIYIINIDDETYCKRVFKDLESGGLILRSDNPIAPEIKLSKNRAHDVKVVGRVGVVLSRLVL